MVFNLIIYYFKINLWLLELKFTKEVRDKSERIFPDVALIFFELIKKLPV